VVPLPWLEERRPLRAPLPKAVFEGYRFRVQVCHELTYEGTQKSGSLFYELIEGPIEDSRQDGSGIGAFTLWA